MSWVPKAGNTLMVRSGAMYREHLHFVLNDPLDFAEEATQSCLLVCATTIHDGGKYDNSCVLDANCHRFITHPSYVPYNFAEVRRAAELERLVETKVFREHDPVDLTFVRRLVACMIDSPRTSRRHKLHAKQVWEWLEAQG